MKTIILAVFCLFTIAAISQSNTTDVIIKDKSGKFNTTGSEHNLTGNKINALKKTNTTQNSEGNIHTVSKGETLYSISKHYGLSMAQIKSVNSLSTNYLKIGQKLLIGYSKSRMLSHKTSHTVVKGETLYVIASNANISVATLKTINNLSSNILTIGQVLKLK